MTRTRNLFLLALALPLTARAQLVLPATGTPVTIDFAGYDGSGFDPAPAPGQLDSDTWSAEGFSDGALPFGGSSTGGDFGRGITDGTGVISGGIYAYDDNLDRALWVQPTTTDFTPGSVTLKVNNATGGTVNQLVISYDQLVLNDQDRANRFSFSYSLDGGTYVAVSALEVVSAEAPDSSLTVVNLSETLSGLGIADGADIFLRWEGDDVSGFGSRDEFGIDNITVEALGGIGPRAFNFANTTVTAAENAGSTAVSVEISGPANCTVDVSVSGGTATDPADYGFSTTTLTFTTAGPFTLDAPVSLSDDALFELPETVTFTLSNVTGPCVLGASTSATLTITDDEDAAEGPCANLYFSEYVEGSGNNKALEIYNPTDLPVTLDGYSVQVFNNGNPTPSNVELLTGTLAPGAVYAIVNDAADPALLALADITSTVTFYNGDDAVILLQGSDTIDAIGQVGVDPGSAWPVGSGFTNEHTLVRQPAVQAGQQDWSLGAGEWNVLPQDDFSAFGSHTQDPCAVGCSTASPPGNLSSAPSGSGFALSWSAVPGSVACQVNGGPVGGPTANLNVIGSEPTGTFVPGGVLTPGLTYAWRVRCACSISPITATGFSVTDSFTVPMLREAVAVFPNPASDRLTVRTGPSAEGPVHAELIDVTGRIRAAATGSGDLHMDLGQLPGGLYWIRWTDDAGHHQEPVRVLRP